MDQPLSSTFKKMWAINKASWFEIQLHADCDPPPWLGVSSGNVNGGDMNPHVWLGWIVLLNITYFYSSPTYSIPWRVKQTQLLRLKTFTLILEKNAKCQDPSLSQHGPFYHLTSQRFILYILCEAYCRERKVFEEQCFCLRLCFWTHAHGSGPG